MLSPGDLDWPVFERFVTVAKRNADHVAVFDTEGACSYQELLGLANRYAALIDTRVQAATAVALSMQPNRHMVAAMLGALAAGRPYVPLDPSYPAAHLMRVVDHSGAGVVIGHTIKDLGLFVGAKGLDARVFTSVDLPATAHAFDPKGGPDTPAYTIYTSGSTGAPKGVWQDQRGLLHDILQYTQMVAPTRNDRLSLLYSPSVNGALRDIYGAILNGATLCMFNLKQQGIAQVQRDLIARRVTILHAMPPILRSLLRHADGPICPDARVLYTAGDRFLASDLAAIRANLTPQCRIYTGIGSTECATLYRHWFVPVDFQPDSTLIPVGYAIDERQMRLVDSTGQEVSPGVIGLIEVSSPFIARGYWNDKALTQANFKPDPKRPGWRRFQPGDLGRLRKDNLLEFLGRADRQIKIRGYRVEPAEIETALRQIKGVNDTAVLVRETNDKSELVAFVEPVQGVDLIARDIQDALKSSLAAHLQPSEVRICKTLPRLENFKLDVKALRAELAKADADTAGPLDVSSPYMALWEQVLRRTIDPDQSIEHMGADSLELLELELLLEREMNISVREVLHPSATPKTVWQNAARATPRHGLRHDVIDERLNELAALMARSDGIALDPDGLVRLYNHNGHRTPLIWCFNHAHEANSLAEAIGDDQPLIAMRSLAGLYKGDAPSEFESRQVTERYIQIILSRDVPQQVVVGGNCQSAPFALQMATALAIAGYCASSLITLDKMLPIPYGGRMMLLFGKDSLGYNPKFEFQNPTRAWGKYLSDAHFGTVNGAHGQFFQPKNIPSLAKALRDEIDLSSETAPLPMNARCLHLTAQMSEEAAPNISVFIKNPNEITLKCGETDCITLTIHVLRAEDADQRPFRLPSLTWPLAQDILPGEGVEITVPLPSDTNGAGIYLIGVCEEGVGWFDLDDASAPLLRV